jgi:hypothetical protein
MIRYALVCKKRHEFESWFANSAAYDKQAKRGLVACPVCGSTKVEKAIMRPRLARTDTPAAIDVDAPGVRGGEVSPAQPGGPVQALPGAAAPPNPVAMISPQEREFRSKLKELRDHLMANAENVGQRFPEEARKMHYGEGEHRSIYGIASPEEARKLGEEGIEFSALPVLPDERN